MKGRVIWGDQMRRIRLGLALLIVGGVACSSNGGGTAVASGISPTPVVVPSSAVSTPSEAVLTCKKADAVDLSDDDLFTINIDHLRFMPNCFIATAEAAIAIANKEEIPHTFAIDGTLVNASVLAEHTYKHSGWVGVLTPGTAYPFHCTIHPQMTGTWFVV